MHYFKRGVELSGDEVQVKKAEFLARDKKTIYTKARELANTELGF